MSKKVINCETGEEFEIELSAEDLAQQEIDAALWAEKEAAKTAKEAARISAQAKLEAIGLTADEIAALRG
jgi:hypothetical protein